MTLIDFDNCVVFTCVPGIAGTFEFEIVYTLFVLFYLADQESSDFILRSFETTVIWKCDQIITTYKIKENTKHRTNLITRIAPALFGLRQALKISIYDYLSKFHQINAELFLNCYYAIIFIAVSQYKFDFGPCSQFCCFGFTLFQW